MADAKPTLPSPSLTKEISKSKQELHIVRKNEEEICIVNTEKDAVYAIDSLAAAHIEKLKEKGKKVFRTDEYDGKIVKIFIEKKGYLTTHLSLKFVYDYVTVSVVTVVQRGSTKQ